jgi:hypothetical protein
MNRVGWQTVDRHEIGRLSSTPQKPGYHRPCDRELKVLLPHRQIPSPPEILPSTGLLWEGACSRRLIDRPHIPFGCTNVFASKLPPTMDRVGWQTVDRHEIGGLSGTLQKPGYYRPCERDFNLLLPHRQSRAIRKSCDQPGLPWEGACSRRLIGRPHNPFGCTNVFASKLPPTMDRVGCRLFLRH